MLEIETLVLPLNDDLQTRLNEKQQQGWMVMPGTIPQGIWVVCRQPGALQPQEFVGGEPKATISINPKGVGVLRNGKFVDEDGNEVPPPQ